MTTPDIQHAVDIEGGSQSSSSASASTNRLTKQEGGLLNWNWNYIIFGTATVAAMFGGLLTAVIILAAGNESVNGSSVGSETTLEVSRVKR